MLYDNTVTAQQAQAFLAGTMWERLGYSVHPVTRTVTIQLADGDTLNIPLGRVIVKHASGTVYAMTQAAFAAKWEAI